MPGVVVSVAETDSVLPAGAEVAVIEAMKMQHGVTTTGPVEVLAVHVAVGDVIGSGIELVATRQADGDDAPEVATSSVDLDAVRPDLAEVLERHRL